MSKAGLVTLTFDLESGVRDTCDVGYTPVPILVFQFLCLSVLDFGPMYATDRRQTDRRQALDKSIAK